MILDNGKRLKKVDFGTVCRVTIYAAISATLCFAQAATSSANRNGGQRKVTLIFHATDQQGNPVDPRVVDIQVAEHGRKLQVIDSPKSEGPLRIALLLDSNYNQRKVLPLEQQTAAEMLVECRKRDTRAVVMSYGTDIYSSGEPTNDWTSLKGFIDSITIDADKHSGTVLLYDAMKRAIESLGGAAGTKAVVVFSEGNDYGSSIGWRQVARLAERAHIACYIAMFADHSFYGREIRHYGYYLVELGPKTGGRLWEVGAKPDKAHQVLQQLIRALDTQGAVEVLAPEGSRADTSHPVKLTSSRYKISAQAEY